MKNSLSNLQANKVGVHDNSHHTEEYATIELLSKEIGKLKIDRNELQEYINGIVNLYDALEEKINRIKNNVIDWSKPQDTTIHNDNIEFPEIEFPVYNHNELKGYEPKEHIDWTKEQSLDIHTKNIPKLDMSNYFNEIEHNNLKGFNKNAHIDWTKEQDKKIHHRNVYIDVPTHNSLEEYKFEEHINHSDVKITTGVGLAGGGNISKSFYIHLRPASNNTLGGVKIGKGLNIDELGKIGVNSNVHPKKYQKIITKWAKDGNKFSHAVTHNLGDTYPQITCWNKKTNMIMYPEVEYINENKVKFYIDDKSIQMIIKVVG